MSVWTTRAEGGTHALDRAEVLHALTLLMDHDQTFELRSLPSGRHRVCHGQDLPAAVEAAWELSDEKGLYFTLNPLPINQDRPGKDRDVLFRRWLLLDIDGVKDDVSLSATESEKVAGYEVAGRMLDYLSGHLHWPSPIIVDSGNGWHLLYRVDLPNDKLSQQLVKSALVCLGTKFDTATARIDRAVHNAARISKLPGSWARKGPDTPERPHRLSRIVYEPEALEVVTVEQLQALVGGVATPTNGVATPSHSPWVGKMPSAGLEAYCRRSVESECGRLSMSTTGDRNNALNRAAFAMGQLEHWSEFDASNAKRSLATTARLIGLEQEEIDKTLASGWEAGKLEPRTRPVEPTRNGKAPEPFDLTKRLIILASEVTPRKVEWLWPNRIPLGKLTTFAGWGGLGKSFVTMDLAARISRGDEIPGMGGECFQPGNVLILNTEDDPEDTSVPRLIEAGADLKRIAFARSEVLGRFTLGDLQTLDAMFAQLGQVRFLVIDPATSFLGGVNDHHNSELRSLLTPLSLWVMERMCGTSLVTHVTKPQASKVEAMARVMGSVAWVNAVRAAVMFAKDPNDPTQRLFIPFKANNAPEQKGLSYRIVKTDALARIEWLGEVDTTADEAINQTKSGSAGEDAALWMMEMFRIRREWESGELKRLGLQAGHTFNALFKSKDVKDLPIKKRPKTNANGQDSWVWIAKDGWPPESPKVET